MFNQRITIFAFSSNNILSAYILWFFHGLGKVRSAFCLPVFIVSILRWLGNVN